MNNDEKQLKNKAGLAQTVKQNPEEKARKKQVLQLLAEEYKDAATALNYNNNFEMLVAVVLSAQCTDKRVNVTTARLFPDYNSAAKMLALGQEQLAELIRDCGLFHSKAKNLIATCRLLLDKNAGQVPDSYAELIKLPGVGRKTANVLLSQLFGQPAIAVDTHVFRVANRLQLAVGTTPLQVEEALMQLIPRSDWSAAHHWLIWHGRKVCKAARPLCRTCRLGQFCPANQDNS